MIDIVKIIHTRASLDYKQHYFNITQQEFYGN